MKYKIQALNGFNMYFDHIISIFKTKYFENNVLDLDELSDKAGINRRKTRIILNFLADIGLSQKRTLKGTKLGEIIYENDDFLQNEGTLWLLHYLQATNEYLVVWNRVMNQLYNVDKFKTDDMIILFDDLKESISEYSFKHHIRKEIRTILDAYTNQRLLRLNLLEDDNGSYIVNRNPDVSNLILLCAIILYRDKYYPGATALNIKEICNNYNSPGKIFILDEQNMRRKLETLKNESIINIESRGDLDQIRLSEELNFESLLESFYKRGA